MGGWKCQHGRQFCRACGFGLENTELTRPGPARDRSSAAAYEATALRQILEIEGDVRRGDPVVLERIDWLVQEGLMPAGQLTVNDCHSARHHLAQKLGPLLRGDA